MREVKTVEDAAADRLFEFIKKDPYTRNMTAPEIGCVLKCVRYMVDAYLSVTTIADREAGKKANASGELLS